MTGVCVAKLPHSCGSSDALQVFEQEDGKVDGYCFSCNKYVEHPFGSPKTIEDIPKSERLGKTRGEIRAEFDEIAECGSVDLPERRLRAKYLDRFGVKVALDQTDGRTPRVVYFPYYHNGELVRYKARLLGAEKRMWNVSLDKDVDLFGWDAAVAQGARRLIITEGEYDAIAITAILDMYTREDFKEHIPAVVSIPNGASGASRDVSKVLTKIRKNFKEVSLCFDNDEAGQKATLEVSKILPNATSIQLPAKDANECILQGLGKEAFKAITFRKEKLKNTHMVLGSSLKDQAKVRPKLGLSWPFEKLTELTRGIRRGETYYFGAGVKMGKSELVDTIAEHLMNYHNLPVFMCKPEQSTVATYQRLVGKAAKKIFHDPNIEFDEDAFNEASELIGDKAIILDSYQFVDWENLKDDIAYAVNNYGVKDVIIDPVTCFTSGMSSTETNEFLIKMAAELSAMAKDLDFTAYIFCHLKAPTNGPPHERGGEVMSTQFTGSRAMMRSCNLMVGLEGNKDPELPLMERNTRKLKILEDREFGASGVVKLYWDHHTGAFNEMRE